MYLKGHSVKVLFNDDVLFDSAETGATGYVEVGMDETETTVVWYALMKALSIIAGIDNSSPPDGEEEEFETENEGGGTENKKRLGKADLKVAFSRDG